MSLFGESIKNLSPAIFQTLLAHKQSGLPQGQTYRESRLQLTTGHVPSHFNSQRREKWKASSTPEQLFVLFLICGGSSFGKHLPGYLELIPMLAPAAIGIEAQAMAVFGGGVKKSEMHTHS